MAGKKLLLLETKSEKVEKYEQFLKETNWELTVRSDEISFVKAFGDSVYQLAIAEEAAISEKVIAILNKKGIPLIISTDFEKNNESLTTIGRDFSHSELINAIGEVSFKKALANKRIDSSEEEAVVLEPVLDDDDDDDAMLLAPEDGKTLTDSSYEIKKEESGNRIGAKFAKKSVTAKTDIFARIDEIDSIMNSLSQDISLQTKTAEIAKEKVRETKPLYDSEKKKESINSMLGMDEDSSDNGADFLFDEKYKFEEKEDNIPETFRKEKKQDSIHDSMLRDFESIITESPLKMNSDSEELSESENANGKNSLEFLEPENTDENSFELEPEGINTHNETASSFETIPEPSTLDTSVLRDEVRQWLEENGRTIIRQVIEEKLSNFSGK